MFARDSFRGVDSVLGGNYVDLATPFGMRDKVAHLLCSALAFVCIARFCGVGTAWAATQLGGIAVELIEVRRKQLGKQFFADDFSWRDLIANNVGALFAWLFL
ncbi:MAG: hypothetical protein A2Y38_16720 [Spirochaetes bacterium GWB1_59_5]|nr:MAG: hypothetical protein A2Y38_16720 [Spirochaetes bacterium GWB1_59_5]